MQFDEYLINANVYFKYFRIPTVELANRVTTQFMTVRHTFLYHILKYLVIPLLLAQELYKTIIIAAIK